MRRRLSPVLVALLWCSPGAATVEVELSFTGLTLDQGTFVCPVTEPSYPFPPDTMGAVGPDHVLELLNWGFAVYQKSDGALVTSGSLLDFWTAAGIAPLDGCVFDPRVVYDPISERFFAVSVDGASLGGVTTPGDFLVAVSASSDPTGGWNGLRIEPDPTGEAWTDFPRIAVDGDALHLAAFLLPTGAGGVGAIAVVVPKEDLLAPAPTVANATLFPMPFLELGDAQPVFDPEGGGLPTVLLSARSAFPEITVFEVGGTASAPTAGPAAPIPVESFPTVLPQGPQPTPDPHVETCEGVFASRLLRRGGSIWGAHEVPVDGRLAIRWLAIDEATRSVAQSGILSDADLSFYCPSISVNRSGVVAIGFSGSSPSQFVSAYAAVGETHDGVTTFDSPFLLQAGQAGYDNPTNSGSRNRWGDYSATVDDPSDPMSFWTFQAYVEADDVWGIGIAKLFVHRPQDKAQQRCVQELHKRGGAVAKAQGAAGLKCLKNAAKGKEADAQTCLARDDAGKVARAMAKTEKGEAKKCGGPWPDFAAEGSATVNAAAAAAALALVEDLFGPDLTAAVIAKASDADAARCQSETLKRARAVMDAAWKDVGSAKKSALRGKGTPAVETATELADAVAAALASGSRLAKARLNLGAAEKRCGGVADLAGAFPGVCPGSGPNELTQCAGDRAVCRSCRALEASDGLTLDCDTLDDGAANASCAGP